MDITDLPRPLTEEQAAEEAAALEMKHTVEGKVATTREKVRDLDSETLRKMNDGEVPFGLS